MYTAATVFIRQRPGDGAPAGFRLGLVRPHHPVAVCRAAAA